MCVLKLFCKIIRNCLRSQRLNKVLCFNDVNRLYLNERKSEKFCVVRSPLFRNAITLDINVDNDIDARGSSS